MPPTVAIVGGGFAGVMVACQLLAPGRVAPPMHVVLIERAQAAGRGAAYGTDSPLHVLNVPAGNMSAWPDRPASFVDWLAAHGGPADPQAFAERRRYAAYLADQLAVAITQAPPSRTFERIHDEAIGLLPEAGGYRLRLAGGRILHADRVVLALGNMPPVPPGFLDAATLAEPWLVPDPWTPAALAPVPAGGDVLLLGTGLTAVDLALALTAAPEPARRVYLVSRRARLPAPWRFTPPYADWLDPGACPPRVSAWLRLMRAEVRRAEAAGHDWQAVFDAMRPHVQALWRRLPLVERRRFLRHARSYWEAHRHRMPPEVAARVAALQAEGRLVVLAARLRGLAPQADGQGGRATLVTRDGRAQTLDVARVVVCTGPALDFRRIRHALVLDLIGTGLARPEPLSLGLDVTPEGGVYDEDGRVSPGLWAIGALRKGALWESTAVPELRGQAADVAERVVASLA